MIMRVYDLSSATAEGEGFLQPQGWKPATYRNDGNVRQVRDVKAMIGRGSNFPSATVEEEMIKGSDAKTQKLPR